MKNIVVLISFGVLALILMIWFFQPINSNQTAPDTVQQPVTATPNNIHTTELSTENNINNNGLYGNNEINLNNRSNNYLTQKVIYRFTP